MTIDASQDSLVFTDKKNLLIYPSLAWGERGFCDQSGSTSFWRTRNHSYCGIRVLALNKQSDDFKLDLEIYIDHKPKFYSFTNKPKSEQKSR